MAEFPETRVSLILRLGEPDDVRAWQEFADIYGPALYRLALRKKEEDRELFLAIPQEVYNELFVNPDGFD